MLILRQRTRYAAFLLLLLVVVAAATSGCNILNDYGDLWSPACTGTGGDGAGGDGSSTDVGVGAGGSDVGTGVSTGVGVSTGAGGSDVGTATGAGAGPGQVRHPPRPPRHRRRTRREKLAEELGVSVEALCPGVTPPVPMMIAPPRNLMPLDTTDLRRIAAANLIGAGQTGIQQSRTIGLGVRRCRAAPGVRPAI
jgi:hypothetical protein